MPWRPAMLRGSGVLARCDEDGNLLVDHGRVEIRYRRGHSRAYRAAVRNLEVAAGGEILADETCSDAEPTRAPGRSPSSRARTIGSSPPAVSGKGPVPEKDAIVAYTDGACSGNPGPAGLGVVLDGMGSRRELSEYLGEGTNNIAELTAIVRALEAAGETSRPVRIYTDSRYAVGVLSEGWKAKANPGLVERARRLLRRLPDASLIHVRGHAGVELNERADELARAAVESRSSTPWMEP